MPGRGHSKAWWKQYEALRDQGKTKASAAKITNAAQKAKKKGSR